MPVPSPLPVKCSTIFWFNAPLALLNVPADEFEQLAAQGDLVFGIQTLTQDAEHLRAIAQIRSQFHVTLE